MSVALTGEAAVENDVSATTPSVEIHSVEAAPGASRKSVDRALETVAAVIVDGKWVSFVASSDIGDFQPCYLRIEAKKHEIEIKRK